MLKLHFPTTLRYTTCHQLFKTKKVHYLGISKRAKAAAVYGDKNVSETKVIIIHLSDNTQCNLITLS